MLIENIAKVLRNWEYDIRRYAVKILMMTIVYSDN